MSLLILRVKPPFQLPIVGATTPSRPVLYMRYVWVISDLRRLGMARPWPVQYVWNMDGGFIDSAYDREMLAASGSNKKPDYHNMLFYLMRFKKGTR